MFTIVYLSYSRLCIVFNCEHAFCRMSKISNQSCIYVGFISEDKKRIAQDPKSEKVLRYSVPPPWLCVFRPAIPPESHPCVALSALPDEVFYVLFRFLAQRYYNYQTYASVLAKKLQKYVVKHKKEGAKAPSLLRNRTPTRLSVKVRQNVVCRQFVSSLQANSNSRHPAAHVLVTICAYALDLLRIVRTRRFVAQLVFRDCHQID